MIERVRISKYRCFSEIEVPLGPLTVLVGANNSGKSAFLSALNLVQEQPKSISVSDRWMFDDSSVPIIELFCDGNAKVTVTEETVQQKGGFGGQGAKRGWKASGSTNLVTPIRFFGGELLAPSMLSPGVTEKQGVPELDNEVKNVPAFLDSLLRKDRTRFDRILSKLRDLIPGLRDLHIATPDAGQRRIDLELDNTSSMNADLASYGVRLMIFFVALANHPFPPKLVLLEEPENGVHPKRLKDIVDLLIGLSEAKYASHPTQVVLTTHSPYLLDYIDISKNRVLVAQRSDDGSRSITAIDENRLSSFLDDFMLGEVWINQGEAGLLQKEH
jgi:predicted ATPase